MRNIWRRGRDLNPRYPCGHSAFRVRCDRPLCHLSAVRATTPCGSAAYHAQTGRYKRHSRAPPASLFRQTAKLAARRVDRRGLAAVLRLLAAGPHAPMAELVDASDSKSDSARSAGSIPARGTKRSSGHDCLRQPGESTGNAGFPACRDARKTGEKYAKFRIQGVEGLAK